MLQNLMKKKCNLLTSSDHVDELHHRTLVVGFDVCDVALVDSLVGNSKWFYSETGLCSVVVVQKFGSVK